MAGQPPEWTRIFHYQGFWSKYKACKEMMMLVFPVRRYTKNVSSGNQPWGLSSNCGLSNSGVGHRPTTTHIFTCSGITVCLLYKSSVWSCANHNWYFVSRVSSDGASHRIANLTLWTSQFADPIFVQWLMIAASDAFQPNSFIFEFH